MTNEERKISVLERQVTRYRFSLVIVIILAIVCSGLSGRELYHAKREYKNTETTSYGNGFIDGYWEGRCDGVSTLEDLFLAHFEDDPVVYDKVFNLLFDDTYHAYWHVNFKAVADEFHIFPSYELTDAFEDEY